MKAITKGIWVWTAKAEEVARKLNLDVRAENAPAMMGHKPLGQIAPKRWLELGYVKEYHGMPEGSRVTSINLAERFGSTFVDVHHTVTDEHQAEYDLWTKKRILSIRLIQGENDKGLPITSFADSLQ